MSHFAIAVALFLVLIHAGCEQKQDPGSSTDRAEAGRAAGQVHAAGDTHDPNCESGAAGTDRQHGGESIEIGTVTIDGVSVRAARDAGELRPGGDVPIDVWIDGGLGSAAIVRFWIGTEDPRRFVRAKAEVEDGKWHTHVEIADPLPAGSKLWVEIELRDGRRHVVSFELLE